MNQMGRPQGLAAQGMEEQQEPVQESQGGEEQMQQAVMQVVQLLMQGVSPDDLLQQGIPREVIQMAIQIIQEQQGQGGQQQPQPGMAQ